MRRPWLAAIATLVACTGAGATSGVEVRDGFLFAPVTQGEAAAYFTAVNRGPAADTLLGLTSPIAASVMVHRQVVDGGLAQMEHVTELAVAPGDSIVLAPGGLHAMLVTLDRLPVAGDSVSLTLRFARAGTITVTVPVRDYGAAP